MSYPPPPPPPNYPGGQSTYLPYGGGYYHQPRGTNGMAVASLVISCVSFFICAPVAVVGAILGHIARNQIRDSGEDGDGVALAGIIIGWIVFGLVLAAVAFYVLVFVLVAANESNY
ncbi:MAG: DUF4190 domain-containing protein [Micromonosporaceae bacterium]